MGAEKYLKQHGIGTGKYMTYKTMASHMESYADQKCREQNKWINVDDELPETGGDTYGTQALSINVLVLDEDLNQFTGFYNYSEAGNPDCLNPWEELFTECPIDTRITHWMPLPELPLVTDK